MRTEPRRQAVIHDCDGGSEYLSGTGREDPRGTDFSLNAGNGRKKVSLFEDV